jgi:hypothetical protein
MKWNVTEDSGGGLALNYWEDEDDDISYIHSGYEYTEGQLRGDIAALYGDTHNDPTSWEGNECNTIDYDDAESTRIIADGDDDAFRVYPTAMGAAGRKALLG